jgi:hypothetical protein
MPKVHTRGDLALGFWELPDDGIDPRLCEQLEIIIAQMRREK